jgi:hypothetical protein
MARIRTIKPDYWTDEVVGECSTSARLLFIATWNFADDNGNLERSAKQLKAKAFPYDSLDVEKLIVELLDAGLLVEYQHDDKIFLHIKGFDKHQKIDRKSAPRCPVYEDSSSIPRGLGSVREGKRKSKGKEEIPLPPFDPKTVPGLNAEAWETWRNYRSAINKPLKTVSLEAAAKQLAGFGHQQQAVVNQSIANQWQGLFALKQTGKPANPLLNPSNYREYNLEPREDGSF